VAAAIEAQDTERHEQSASSTAKNHNRFIGTSAGDAGEKLDGRKPRRRRAFPM
jgi:hypothetical protein